MLIFVMPKRESHSEAREPEAEPAAAVERRRPPLRPRRGGFDSRESPLSEDASSFSGAASSFLDDALRFPEGAAALPEESLRSAGMSTNEATALVRPASSIRT